MGIAFRKPLTQRTPWTGRFTDRVAIVTGGSNGIGRAIVEELCREGAKVVFTGVSDAGGKTAEQLTGAGHDVKFLQGDMVEPATAEAIVERTLEAYGKVDYLVNNAFSFVAKGTDATEADWHRSLFVGPVAYARMVTACAEPMKQAGGGAIVNMSSISAFIAQTNRWTYNAAKGAVLQLTRCQALDLRAHSIRVNSVSPGWIWTREVEKASMIDGGGREKWEPVWGEYHMAERLGEAVECAGPVLFLLSDDASFITATDLPIDAGYQSMGPEGLGKTAAFAGSV